MKATSSKAVFALIAVSMTLFPVSGFSRFNQDGDGAPHFFSRLWRERDERTPTAKERRELAEESEKREREENERKWREKEAIRKIDEEQELKEQLRLIEERCVAALASGWIEDAIRSCKYVLRQREAEYGRESPTTIFWRVEYARTLAILETVESAKESERQLLLALSLRVEYGPGDPAEINILEQIRALYASQNRNVDANSVAIRILKIQNGNDYKNFDSEKFGYQKIKRLLESGTLINNFAQALSYVSDLEKKSPKYDSRLLRAVSLLANAYLSSERPSSALPFLKKQLELTVARSGPYADSVFQLHRTMISIYSYKNDVRSIFELDRKFLDSLVAESKKSEPRFLSSDIAERVAFSLQSIFSRKWLYSKFDEIKNDVSMIGELPIGQMKPVALELSRTRKKLKALPVAVRSLRGVHAGLANGDDRNQALNLYRQAVDAVALGRTGEAIDTLTEGLLFGELHMRRIKSPRGTIDWLRDQKPFLSLAIELARKDRTSDAALQAAWLATLIEKGRTLDSESKVSRFIHTPSLLADNAPVVHRFEVADELKRKVTMAGKDYKTARDHKQQSEDTLDFMLRDQDELWLDSYPEPYTWVSEVAKQIPPGSVLVEYLQHNPPEWLFGTSPKQSCYLALMLFSDGQMKLIELGDANTSGPSGEALRSYLTQLRDPDTHPDPRQSAMEVYNLFLREVIEQAAGATDLFIVPDGALNLIPFEALHTGSNYVLESPQRIHYLSSGRDLLKMYRGSSSGEILVLGDPSLDAALNNPIAKTTSYPVRGADYPSITLYDAVDSLEKLGGARDEAIAIAQKLGTIAKIGKDATERILRSAGALRILHLATHGIFLDDYPDSGASQSSSREKGPSAVSARSQDVKNSTGGTDARRVSPTKERNVEFAQAQENGLPTVPTLPQLLGQSIKEPMLSSAIPLAGARHAAKIADGRADGILTADEVKDLKLDGTELVVLSACETARGSVLAGQGVYGLRRAFLSAGAEAVVASLWRVPDVATGSLMERYYDLMITKRRPRLSAMREAMKEFKNDGQGHEHPYYWAAFIGVGRDEPLRPIGATNGSSVGGK